MTPEMMLAKALSTTPVMVEKTASAEFDNSVVQDAIGKLSWAEDLGRGLAKESAFNAKALGEAAKTFGKSTSALHRTAIGAGVGGVAGALSGGGYEPDPTTGQMKSRSRLARGLAGSVVGGAAGGLSHGEGRQFAEQKGRQALGVISDKAKALSKTGSMQKVAVLPAIGGALARAAAAPAAKRMAIGAGVGALGGALKNPGVDPATGQQKSRLGAMAVGAGLGAAAGKALPRGVSAIGARSGGIREGINAAAKGTPGLSGIAGRTNAAHAAMPVKTPGAVPGAAPAAAPAAPASPAAGGAPAARPPPSAESKANLEKLKAQMGARRAGEQQLAAGGLSQQEVAMRQAHGKGMPAAPADPNMEVFKQRAAVQQAQAQNSTAGGRVNRAIGRVTGSNKGVMAQPMAGPAPKASSGAKAALASKPAPVQQAGQVFPQMNTQEVRASINPDRVDMSELYKLMLERTGRG